MSATTKKYSLLAYPYPSVPPTPAAALSPCLSCLLLTTLTFCCRWRLTPAVSRWGSLFFSATRQRWIEDLPLTRRLLACNLSIPFSACRFDFRVVP
ncbi:hypothetical protein CPSG_07058 [Coccidioides posadasii str. Silveira]|uniref:Uncharacterized protein n=1 Tax=Coccidioides posadasii (strain RMSCC 757 / Silveira) TaxID=443226 RepID=E9DB56_COCPS|nr:hypothetical protein CPSG_07058 [Coccidioides posadasii str. Silveira]